MLIMQLSAHWKYKPALTRYITFVNKYSAFEAQLELNGAD
jgi:hypothetical protein